MKKSLLILLAVLAAVGVSCRSGSQDDSYNTAPKRQDQHPSKQGGQIDGKEYFRYETLNEDLVVLANDEYGRSKPDYSDPENDIGTPPFEFVKRVDCDVIHADERVEKLIKRTPETATFHTIVVLRDARKNLYAFTLTSTVPDKSVVRLQHYGPLTNENPEVVNLPINRRRLTEFPIDFNTGKPLKPKDGRCVYIPYPVPADQEYWIFGDDPHSSPLQGLYRNDRYKNADEVINLITEAVKQEDASGGVHK